METNEYKNECLVTESPITSELKERFSKEENLRLLHASLGMQTESAEFADMLKKHLFYGKQIDTVNLQEELGDLLWYVSIALDVLGTSYIQVMKTNISKLKSRYPNKFTEYDAQIRNLTAEREILESGCCGNCNCK